MNTKDKQNENPLGMAGSYPAPPVTGQPVVSGVGQSAPPVSGQPAIPNAVHTMLPAPEQTSTRQPVQPNSAPYSQQVPPLYAGQPMPYYPPNGYAPVAKREKKGRRVGTFTMALSLIAFGVVLLLRVFLPGLDYAMIARLSPIVLIFLGVEVIVANAMHKEGKLYYDGVSMVICLFLLVGSLLSAVLPELYYRDRQRELLNQQMMSVLDEYGYATLSDVGIISSIEWYANVGDTLPSELDREITKVEDIQGLDYVQARVYLDKSFTTRAEFAKACQEVVKKMGSVVEKLDYMSFYNAEYENNIDDANFYLPLNGPHQINWDVKRMEKAIEGQYKTVGGSYIYDWDIQNMLENGFEEYDDYSIPILWEQIKQEYGQAPLAQPPAEEPAPPASFPQESIPTPASSEAAASEPASEVAPETPVAT